MTGISHDLIILLTIASGFASLTGAVGWLLSESASAGKHDRVNGLCRRERIRQSAFTGRGAAPADIQARGHAFRTDQHRAPGSGIRVFRLADP